MRRGEGFRGLVRVAIDIVCELASNRTLVHSCGLSACCSAFQCGADLQRYSTVLCCLYCNRSRASW